MAASDVQGMPNEIAAAPAPMEVQSTTEETTVATEKAEASWQAEEAAKAAEEAASAMPAAQAPDAHKDWEECLGSALETPLRSGALRLLDAEYVVKMADEGCAIQPRQLLPPEAFISLEKDQGGG